MEATLSHSLFFMKLEWIWEGKVGESEERGIVIELIY